MAPSDKRGDDSLLARLNALKKSSVTMLTAPPGAEIQPDVLREVADESAPLSSSSVDDTKDPVLDLATRFKRLHTPSPRSGSSGKATPAAEDAAVDFGGEEKSLDVLLKELGGDDWDMSKGEEKDVGRLVKEVRNVLPAVETPETGKQEPRREKKSEGEFDEDAKELDVGNVDPEQAQEEADQEALDDQEADEYIAQVLAELEIQEKYSETEDAGQNQDRNHHAPHKAEESKPIDKEKGDDTLASNTTRTDPGWSLPAVPRDLPKEDSGTGTPDDEALNARLAALSGNPSLPSAPSFAPSKKPPIKTNKSEFTDEEIDSWCIICYDNATLRCLGCDCDFYCRKCWVEGHKGESAGFEERTHRAVEFVRGGDVKKTKVAIGAG